MRCTQRFLNSCHALAPLLCCVQHQGLVATSGCSGCVSLQATMKQDLPWGYARYGLESVNACLEVNVVILPWLQATLGHMFNATEEAISSPLPSPQPTSPRPFSPLAQGRLLQPHSLYQHSSAGFHAPHLRCLPTLGISGCMLCLVTALT